MGTGLVLGKHSGRHAFVNRLKELGIDVASVDVERAFAEFKALCDKKKVVYDDDIIAVVTEEARRTAEHFELIDVNVQSSTKSTPHAHVLMRVEGKEHQAEATGDGVVDATYKAILKIAQLRPVLERYSVKAITGGTDALGEVSCLLRDEGMTVAGHGAHSDIVVASALALVNALNRLKAGAHMRIKPTDAVA
jgi:2-isopropylmalate synthase